jgi:formylglycine-generating enzyme required for sulfatase activity
MMKRIWAIGFICFLPPAALAAEEFRAEIAVEAVRITWTADVGTAYQVQYSTDNVTWINMGSPVLAGETSMYVVDNVFGRQRRFYRVEALPAPEDMLLIPGGKFNMGDTCMLGFSDETPVHSVTLDTFYMKMTEVTNEEYASFLNAEKGQLHIVPQAYNGRYGVYKDSSEEEAYIFGERYEGAPNRILYQLGTFASEAGYGDHPVVNVTWYGAAAFCNYRSRAEGLDECYDPLTWECDFLRDGYRLPTEAEWEYAARGGNGYKPGKPTYYPYPWGDTIDGTKANYWGSKDPWETGTFPQTTPVAYYQANGFGLYDVIGNAWEWCNDWYAADYYDTIPFPENNPKGPATGMYRVLRGGGWEELFSNPKYLRCAYRNNASSLEAILNSSGFRCVSKGPQ